MRAHRSTKRRPGAARVASLRPSTFNDKASRDWIQELKDYIPDGPRGKPYGHSFGVRTFPEDLSAWLEAIADEHDRKVGETEAFCIGEGARLLLSLTGVDRYRDSRKACRPRASEHAPWFNSFRFPIDAVHTRREDFQITKTEWGHVCKLVKILGLPIPQLIPLCVMAVAMSLPPVHREAGRAMLKTVRKFVEALNDRAAEAEQRAVLVLAQPAPRPSRESFDDLEEE
jgi:hypothetical protein